MLKRLIRLNHGFYKGIESMTKYDIAPSNVHEELCVLCLDVILSQTETCKHHQSMPVLNGNLDSAQNHTQLKCEHTSVQAKRGVLCQV